MADTIALVGGTGPEGFGLGLRLAKAGRGVVIGSRTVERAAATAEKIRGLVPEADVRGAENVAAIDCCEQVVLALPFAGLSAFLDHATPRLAGKLVVDVVVPLVVRAGFAELVPVPGASSAGELIQRRVPAARVVSALKNLPAAKLGDLACPLEGDVLVCGDDAGARAETAALVELLPGVRAVDAGPIGNARYIEAITALLLNLNRRHQALTSIAVLGLPRSLSE